MTRRILCAVFALALCFSLALAVSADSYGEQLLYDDADLLTDYQEAELARKLADISRTYSAQLIVATIPSLSSGDMDGFADYLYDSMDFGYGENRDGAMLLVCMDPREYRILSNGYAGVAIGPRQIDSLCQTMNTYLPGGHYDAAFHAFAEQSGVHLENYLVGASFDAGRNLAISLAIGLAVGLIAVFVMKSQLTSVRMQNHAGEYVKPGSMQLRIRRDIFLYRNVQRVKKPEATSSSRGGSGGGSRSRGGGSF